MMERRTRLQLREKRRIRQHKIWCILRFFISYQDLYCSQNFYEYRDNLKNYRDAISSLEKEDVMESDFRIAFRFCSIKNNTGKCDRAITQSEKEIALNWKDYKIDLSEVLFNVLVSFQDYWDEVVMSYKKPSARQNRIKYLIDKLEEFKTWPELKNISGLIAKISQLQRHYSELA